MLLEQDLRRRSAAQADLTQHLVGVAGEVLVGLAAVLADVALAVLVPALVDVVPAGLGGLHALQWSELSQLCTLLSAVFETLRTPSANTALSLWTQIAQLSATRVARRMLC